MTSKENNKYLTTTIGRVKWFNTPKGCGIITITDGKYSGNDIFVHHSSINSESKQYKYLVGCEYVELDIFENTENSGKLYTKNIKGVKGSKLLCEYTME